MGEKEITYKQENKIQRKSDVVQSFFTWNVTMSLILPEEENNCSTKKLQSSQGIKNTYQQYLRDEDPKGKMNEGHEQVNTQRKKQE